ncbi:hypothetical protein ACFQZO_09295 [Bradyrhizobium sp. GCM10027634]|uniref:hypothetical protein n=1 Tax=unclassified Bradyrhizobium TaxID=2631580 RepID=UPI00263A5035|nr:hypothetical protein [Bradyrhizobium sp. WYCCWR 12677]MDN5001073.1 hypothetical protein [Bradyrhizobium sp. WYCCWR 12677]
MERNIFLERLASASSCCRDFTAGYVSDLLADGWLYWTQLNCSYDKHPLRAEEIVFPDDVQKYGSRVGPLDAEGVADLLWRDGAVPEWIDISVR